jgi:hypothetical protein
MLTGTGPSFRDKKGVGNSLRIRPVNSLPLIQSLVEFVGQEDGTHFCAVVAAGAFTHVHVTWMPSKDCLEASGVPLQGDEF